MPTLTPLREKRLGGLRKGTVRRAGAGVALFVALHPPHRDLEQSPAWCPLTRTAVTFKIQGLSDRGARAPVQDDDAGDRRVHPSLPAACGAQGLPSSSDTMGCSPTAHRADEHCTRQRKLLAVRVSPVNNGDRASQQRSTNPAMICRVHARAAAARHPIIIETFARGCDAEAKSGPTFGSGGNQDRHVMIRAINRRRTDVSSGWSTTGDADPLPDVFVVDRSLLQLRSSPRLPHKIRVSKHCVGAGNLQWMLHRETRARPQSL